MTAKIIVVQDHDLTWSSGGDGRYTSKMLLAAIDEHHKGTYDFIYLPIDFKASAIYSPQICS